MVYSGVGHPYWSYFLLLWWPAGMDRKMKTYEIKIHLSEEDLSKFWWESIEDLAAYLHQIAGKEASIRVVELDTIEGYVNE